MRSDAGTNPEKLFNSKAEDYQKWRSSYPDGIIDSLRLRIGLDESWRVAEVGAGTGILSELILGNGCHVTAIEPNDDMRREAERRMTGRPGFASVAGSAEATGLADGSVDLIVSAQSFHYFDQPRARAEFERLLTPRGTVLVLWNAFDQDMPSYDAFMALQRDHAARPELVRRRNFAQDERLDAFFTPEGYDGWVIRHSQDLTAEGLAGLLFSLSYMPGRAAPGAQGLHRAVAEFIRQHGEEGRYRLRYQLQCHLWRRGAATSR